MEILFTTELALTNMSERQRAYRANSRQRVAGWYDGFLHIAIVYTIGLAALYIYIATIRNLSWAELVTVPVVFLFCDFFGWFLHRYIVHRPWKNTISALRCTIGTRCSIISSLPKTRCASPIITG